MADELEDVCARLTPFASRGLKEFGEFLAKAEQFDREGVISTGGKSPRKTPAVKSTDRLEEARARAKSLFDNALNPNLTVKAIEQQLGGYGDLSKADLESIAASLEITRRFTRKADVLAAIIKRIVDRKGMHDRTFA